MQTPRDVLDGLVRLKGAERVGLFDSPWGDTMAKWLTQGYPTDDEGKAAVGAEEHFGYDKTGAGGWFDWQPNIGFSETVEETDEWIVRKNGSGASLKWWKNKSGTPEHVAFTMNCREIWESDYKPHVIGSVDKRITDDSVKGAKDAIARAAEKGLWSHYGNQFLWENMRASLGDENLYVAMVAEPEWIHDYCRTYTDLYIDCYRKLIEQGGKPDGMWIYEDLGYRDRLFVAPEVYRDTIFVYYAELVAFFHSYDIPVVLHTCGYTAPAMDLIVGAGFDGVNPMEVKAGNDILKMAEQYGEKISFWGGLDARILESGDRDVIRRGVADIMEGMKSRGAMFVFASDHSLSTNIHYEDYKYAVEVYREHMMY